MERQIETINERHTTSYTKYEQPRKAEEEGCSRFPSKCTRRVFETIELVPYSNATSKKANFEEMSNSIPRRKVLLKPFNMLCDLSSQRQRICPAHGPIISYLDEIPLPHHNFDVVVLLKKIFNIGLARTIRA